MPAPKRDTANSKQIARKHFQHFIIHLPSRKEAECAETQDSGLGFIVLFTLWFARFAHPFFWLGSLLLLSTLSAAMPELPFPVE
jgi:hypothetical protein